MIAATALRPVPAPSARFRAAQAQRRRLLSVVSAPALISDARCGDADARHTLETAQEQLDATQREIALLEAIDQGAHP
jgi:hypothetical protein